jgi:hypothetical protein
VVDAFAAVHAAVTFMKVALTTWLILRTSLRDEFTVTKTKSLFENLRVNDVSVPTTFDPVIATVPARKPSYGWAKSVSWKVTFAVVLTVARPPSWFLIIGIRVSS